MPCSFKQHRSMLHWGSGSFSMTQSGEHSQSLPEAPLILPMAPHGIQTLASVTSQTLPPGPSGPDTGHFALRRTAYLGCVTFLSEQRYLNPETKISPLGLTSPLPPTPGGLPLISQVMFIHMKSFGGLSSKYKWNEICGPDVHTGMQSRNLHF